MSKRLNLKLFEIEFLPEALEYLNEIPIKAKDKILFNMARQNLRKILSCSSHCKMEFGISELNTLVFIIEFLHFGTKLIKLKPW